MAAGIVGAFVAGYASDKVFGHRRPPVAFIGYVLQVASLAVVWRAPSVEAVIVAFIVNSLAISMLHSMLSGTASMDFGGKRAAASAAGLFDGMQYIGGSFTGTGLGWLLEHYGGGAWGPKHDRLLGGGRRAHAGALERAPDAHRKRSRSSSGMSGPAAWASTRRLNSSRVRG